jgi:hypothetical protein
VTSLQTLVFKVYCRDAFGNPIVKPSIYFAIAVDGNRGSNEDHSAYISDNDDGSCTVSLTFIWSGYKIVNLLVCDQDIKDSPIGVRVEPDPTEKDRYVKVCYREDLQPTIF